MERFLIDIRDRVCVDFDNKEVKDIQKALEMYLKRMIAALNNEHPYFNVSSIVPCGSMAERTRNWGLTRCGLPILEFDYLAILSLGRHDVTDSCTGFMNINDISNSLPPKYRNRRKKEGTSNMLDQSTISYGFMYDMLTSVSWLCDCLKFDETSEVVPLGNCCTTFSPGRIVRNDTKKDCSICKIEMETGCLQMGTGVEIGSPFYHNCSLVFQWTRRFQQTNGDCSPPTTDSVLVLVDFLPSVDVLHNQYSTDATSPTESKQANITSNQHACFLVPKTCNDAHETCWKVSHCSTEVAHLQSSHTNHRQSYMILKFMIGCLFKGYPESLSGYDGVPTTYKLKTVVLHHCNSCKRDPPVVGKCAREILLALSESFKKAILSHFVNKLNLLSPKMFREFPNEHVTWHSNRSKVTGACLKYIADNWGTLIHTIESPYEYELVVEMLILVGGLFKKAWLMTDVDSLYEVDAGRLQEDLKLFNCGETETFDATAALKKTELTALHWTQKLHPVQFERARKLYAFHHMECTELPLMDVSKAEEIIIACKKSCGFPFWRRDKQMEWESNFMVDPFVQEALASENTTDLVYIPDSMLLKRKKERRKKLE